MPQSGDPTIDMVLERTPPYLMKWIKPFLTRWPGRVGLRAAAATIRIEIFDRSMTIAAQLFTSVFPVLILLSALFHPDESTVADAINLPSQTEQLLDDVLGDTPDPTFGLVGAAIVLISATSLSRALTRAFAAIWQLPRPRTKLNAAWRWLALVLGLALALVAVRGLVRLTERLPPPDFWTLALWFSFDVALAVGAPILLLAGAVKVRMLLPGALVYAVAMLFVRPAAAVFLPHALDSSADKYGSIGVAFTYLAYLYVIAWCLLMATILGQVVATDQGWLGGKIRGSNPIPSEVNPVVAGVDEPPD